MQHFHPVVVFREADGTEREMIHSAFCATRAHAHAAVFRYMERLYRRYNEVLRPFLIMIRPAHCDCADAPHEWWGTAPEPEDGSWIEFGAQVCYDREC